MPSRKSGDSTSIRGRLGEELAARYLEERGYRIVEKNFRRRTGEVDMVCQRPAVVVFVEVKRWPRAFMSELQFALSERRRERLHRTAELFLKERPTFRGRALRFDLVFIDRQEGEIRHIPGAL